MIIITIKKIIKKIITVALVYIVALGISWVIGGKEAVQSVLDYSLIAVVVLSALFIIGGSFIDLKFESFLKFLKVLFWGALGFSIATLLFSAIGYLINGSDLFNKIIAYGFVAGAGYFVFTHITALILSLKRVQNLTFKTILGVSWAFLAIIIGVTSSMWLSEYAATVDGDSNIFGITCLSTQNLTLTEILDTDSFFSIDGSLIQFFGQKITNSILYIETEDWWTRSILNDLLENVLNIETTTTLNSSDIETLQTRISTAEIATQNLTEDIVAIQLAITNATTVEEITTLTTAASNLQTQLDAQILINSALQTEVTELTTALLTFETTTETQLTALTTTLNTLIEDSDLSSYSTTAEITAAIETALTSISLEGVNGDDLTFTAFSVTQFDYTTGDLYLTKDYVYFEEFNDLYSFFAVNQCNLRNYSIDVRNYIEALESRITALEGGA